MSGGSELVDKQRRTNRDSKRPDIRCFAHAIASLSFGTAPKNIADLGKNGLIISHFGGVLHIA